MNHRFTECTGYSYEEAIGQNPRILKSDYAPAEVYRTLWETITRGEEWRGEFRNRDSGNLSIPDTNMGLFTKS